jgi:hypothetical protein
MPNTNAIFISAGKQERFATFAIKNLVDQWDIILAWYPPEPPPPHLRPFLFAHARGTKFTLLKDCYQQYLASYRNVWLCDDDIAITTGTAEMLLNTNFQVVSPAHCPSGKISWEIMKPVNNSLLRQTDFVEMTAPLFNQAALSEFMAIYDKSVVGY